MRKILAAPLSAAILAAAGGSAQASTATTTFQVTAAVLATCSVSQWKGKNQIQGGPGK